MSKPTKTKTPLNGGANGKHLRPPRDGRSTEAKRYRKVLGDLIASAGGLAKMTPHEVEIAKRCAAHVVFAERHERYLVREDPAFNADLYLRACGALRRMLMDLGGLERPARGDDDDTPDDTLEAYLARVAKEDERKRRKRKRQRL